jgi:hypothetical protein
MEAHPFDHSPLTPWQNQPPHYVSLQKSGSFYLTWASLLPKTQITTILQGAMARTALRLKSKTGLHEGTWHDLPQQQTLEDEHES